MLSERLTARQTERLVKCFVDKGICATDFLKLRELLDGETDATISDLWAEIACGKACSSCASCFQGDSCPGGNCQPKQCPPGSIPVGADCLPSPVKDCPDGTKPASDGTCGMGPLGCPAGQMKGPNGCEPIPSPPGRQCQQVPSKLTEKYWKDPDLARQFCEFVAEHGNTGAPKTLCDWWTSYTQGLACYEEAGAAMCAFLNSPWYLSFFDHPMFPPGVKQLVKLMLTACEKKYIPPGDCPPGTVKQGNFCVCPNPGEVYDNGKQACVKPGPGPGPATCPDGQVYNPATGLCEDGTQPQQQYPWDCVDCAEAESGEEACEWLVNEKCPQDPSYPECLDLADYCAGKHSGCVQAQNPNNVFDCVCCSDTDDPAWCEELKQQCPSKMNDPAYYEACKFMYDYCNQRSGGKLPAPGFQPGHDECCPPNHPDIQGKAAMCWNNQCYVCPDGSVPISENGAEPTCPETQADCPATKTQVLWGYPDSKCYKCNEPNSTIIVPSNGVDPPFCEVKPVCPETESSGYDPKTGKCHACPPGGFTMLHTDEPESPCCLPPHLYWATSCRMEGILLAPDYVPSEGPHPDDVSPDPGGVDQWGGFGTVLSLFP